jgi:D-arginine dehydrogenase
MARGVTAVIGAGIVGCLAARELVARDQRRSVAVLDRDAAGTGASRRSAGLHLPRGATPRTRRMSAYSHAYYLELRRRHPGLPIYPVGATVVRGEPAGGQLGGGQLGGGYLGQAAPAPAGPLSNADVCLPGGSRAWHLAGCHYAEVYQLVQVIAGQLRPRVRFGEGVAVTGLHDGPGQVIVACGTGERLAADSVILAPGPWLNVPAWRDLVAPLGLRVKKIVALHIEQRPGPADDAVIFDDDDAFLLPLARAGHWLFSYSCQEWDVDPDALTAGVSAGEIAAARACLGRYSPVLADACAAGRVFCDAYSQDREPVVRALDEAGRIVFAGAASGSGYRLAPAIASQAVDLLHLQPSEGVTDDHQYV